MQTQTQPFLLTEYHALSPTDFEMKEINGNKRVILKGVLQRANTINGNGRLYDKAILEQALGKYSKFIAEKRSIGELNHNSSTEIDLKNVSHVIEQVWWEGNDLKGSIRLLNTTSGKEAQALIDDGITLGISTRGLGSITQKGNVISVNEDYHLICWDLVHDPSVTGAFMLKEGKYIKLTEDWAQPESVQRKVVENKLKCIAESILNQKVK